MAPRPAEWYTGAAVGLVVNRFRAAAGGLPPVFWTLWAGMLVNRLASFVITFLALYLVRERGFNADAAGRVVALYGVGLLLAGPLGGYLADHIGRRLTMLLGLAAGGLCVAVIGFVRDPAALSLLAFLSALTGDVYRPAANAAVADVVPPRDRARAYGLIYWAVNLGWAVSLSVAGFVAERSMLALFLADAVTSFAFAGIVWRRVPETRPLHHAPAPVVGGLVRVFRDGPFVVFLGLHLVVLVIFTQFQLAAPLDFADHGVGPMAFSLLMALNGIGVVILQPLLAPYLPRHDGARVLALSAVMVGLGYGMNAFAGSLPAYAAGTLLYTVGEVLGFPVATAIVADLAPPDLRGRYQGAFSMTWGLAFTLSPLIGGEVLHRLGGRALWLGCLAVALLVAVGHLLAGPARRRRLAWAHAAHAAQAVQAAAHSTDPSHT
jgi:MFS family permease